MSKVTTAFLLLLTTYSVAQTQKLVFKVHSSLPTFEARIHKLHSSENDWFDQIDWIEIRTENRKVQTIRFPEDERPTFHKEERDFALLQDVDCDGYKDLVVQKESGVSGDTSYYLYRFNHSLGKFVEYKKFAELSFLGGFRPTNCKTKMVKSYLKSGSAGCEYEASDYRWTHGELVLVRKEVQDYDEKQASFVRKIETWTQGKMKAQTRKIAEDGCHVP